MMKLIDRIKTNRFGVLLVLLGALIPLILYPFTSMTYSSQAMRNAYFTKGVAYSPTLQDLELVLVKGEWKSGRENFGFGDYEGRVALPYGYAVAFGTLLFFMGIGLVVLYRNTREPDSAAMEKVLDSRDNQPFTPGKNGRKQEMVGYIYLLSNSLVPGIVKIGRTDRTPADRIAELSNPIEVPGPFKLEYFCFVLNPEQVERDVYEELRAFRVNDNREFFRVSIDEAKATIRKKAFDGHIAELSRYIDEDFSLLVDSLFLKHSSKLNDDFLVKLVDSALLNRLSAMSDPYLLKIVDSVFLKHLAEIGDDHLIDIVEHIFIKKPLVKKYFR